MDFYSFVWLQNFCLSSEISYLANHSDLRPFSFFRGKEKRNMFRLGHPVGGATSSGNGGITTNTMGGHRGHGFASGHVNFELPSRNLPVQRGRTGARTLTPDRFLGRENRHGNAE